MANLASWIADLEASVAAEIGVDAELLRKGEAASGTFIAWPFGREQTVTITFEPTGQSEGDSHASAVGVGKVAGAVTMVRVEELAEPEEPAKHEKHGKHSHHERH